MNTTDEEKYDILEGRKINLNFAKSDYEIASFKICAEILYPSEIINMIIDYTIEPKLLLFEFHSQCIKFNSDNIDSIYEIPIILYYLHNDNQWNKITTNVSFSNIKMPEKIEQNMHYMEHDLNLFTSQNMELIAYFSKQHKIISLMDMFDRPYRYIKNNIKYISGIDFNIDNIDNIDMANKMDNKMDNQIDLQTYVINSSTVCDSYRIYNAVHKGILYEVTQINRGYKDNSKQMCSLSYYDAKTKEWNLIVDLLLLAPYACVLISTDDDLLLLGHLNAFSISTETIIPIKNLILPECNCETKIVGEYINNYIYIYMSPNSDSNLKKCFKLFYNKSISKDNIVWDPLPIIENNFTQLTSLKY